MSRKPKKKMFRVVVDGPQTLMIYEQNRTAVNEYLKSSIRISEATDLEIAQHVRANLPIIGEPSPVVADVPPTVMDLFEYAAAETAEGGQFDNETQEDLG